MKLFILCVIAFWSIHSFASGREAIDYKTKIYKQYADCLIVKTPYYTVVFNKKNGEIVGLHFKGHKRDMVGSPLPAIGWDSIINGAISPFPKKNCKVTINKTGKRKLIIDFKIVGGSEGTASLELNKQYNLSTDTPVINSVITVFNSGPMLRFQYRMYHGIQPDPFNDKLFFLYPLDTGTTRYDGKLFPYPESANKRSIANVENFTSGWVATMIDKEKKGMVLETNYNQISKMRNIHFYPCVEVTYKPQVLRQGKTFKTFFNLIPIDGLNYFDYASKYLAVQIDKAHGSTSIKLKKNLKMKILGLVNMKKISLRIAFIHKNGTSSVSFGKKDLDLSVNKIQDIIFPETLPPTGAYGLRVQIMHGEKELGKFTVPCIIGDSHETFKITRPGKLIDKDAALFPAGQYIKARNKRKKTQVLVLKNWSSNTSYHVIENLQKRHDINIKVAEYFKKKLTGFPLAPEEYMNYDVIVLVDVPANVLIDQDIKNLQAFTAAGGMLIVYPGSMSAGSFHGSALESLLPVQVSDKDPKLNWKKMLWARNRQRSPVKINKKAYPILQGLNSVSLPESTFFPCKLKAGCEELLSVNNQPLLAIKKNKLGIIAFWGIHPDRRDLLDPFTTWNFYDELLNNLLHYGLKKQKILSIKKFTPPKGILTAPGKGKAVVLLKNNGSKTLSGELIYQLIGKKKTQEHILKFSLKSEQEKTLTLAFNVPPLSAQYQFKMTVKNKGMAPQSIDCTVSAQPSSRLIPQILEHDFNGRSDMRKKRQRLTEWALGRGDVFTQDSVVPLPVKIVSTTKGKLRYELKITDSRGKLINKFPSKILSGSNSYSINNSWKSPLLARGAYTVSGKLYKGDKLVDKFQEKLYYEHKADWEDFYPIHLCYLGYGGRDAVPVNKGIEEVKLLKKMGFNTIGYGYYTDEILKQGLNYSTISDHKIGIWIRNKNFRAPLSESAIKKYITRTHKYFKRRPRLAFIQTDDETQMMKKDGEGKIDKAIFEKEYGYPMPTDPKDKNWYHAVAFKAKGMAAIMRKARKIARKYAPVEGLKKDRAICFPNTHYNLSHDPYAMFHDGPGSARYVLMEKWIQVKPQLIDYTLAWTWAATNFSKTRLGVIMGIIADDGTEWKSGLGFWLGLSYSAKFMEGYTWVSTHGYIPESKERIDVVSKTLKVMNKLGPAFLYLNKSRANVAILCPWMTGRTLDDKVKLKWDLNYTMLRALFGQVDVLFDQQTKSELDKYQLLVIPSGAKSIHQDTQRNIVRWVKNSKGLLVISNDAAMQDQNRDPSDKLRELINEPQYAKRVLTCNLIKIGAKEKVWKFAADKVDLIATSSNPQVICDLHSPASKAAWVITTVNMSREKQSTLLRVRLPRGKYTLRDMLTGEKIKAEFKQGICSIKLTLPPAWGRVIIASEHFPETIKLKINNCARGGLLKYSIEAIDKQGKLVNWPLVCSITVQDPSGKTRIEYGGRHVSKKGKYIRQITIPSNEITGEWTIEVSEPVSRKTVKKKFKIN